MEICTVKQCAWSPIGNKICLSIHLRNYGSHVTKLAKGVGGGGVSLTVT